MKNINVLYVDDDLKSLENFRAGFSGQYNVFTALFPDTAKIILGSREIQVLIVVQRAPDSLDTQFLEAARQINTQQFRILLTDCPQNEATLEAIRSGLIFRSVLKSFDPVILKNVIDASYQAYSLAQIQEHLVTELLKTQEELETLRIK